MESPRVHYASVRIRCPECNSVGLTSSERPTALRIWIADPAMVQPHVALLGGKRYGCYEKAGFRAVGQVQTPDGLALLMVCERPAEGQ